MLVVLFGRAGVGKNYVGELMANQLGYYFWDADEALPTEMIDCIRNQISFTQTMRDQFTQIIIQRIKQLLQSHKKVVIAQALYKEINRQKIQSEFKDANFIYITAEPDVVSQRFKKRFGIVDEAYAKKIAVFFEEPRLNHAVIINNESEEAILQQLQKLKIT